MATMVVNTIDAKDQFSELVNRVALHKERVILVRRGKEIAVLVPIEDFELIQTSQDKHDLREAIEALKDARHHGAITLENFREKIGI